MGKDASFAVISMTSDSLIIENEGFCDSPPPPPPHTHTHTPKERNSLDRKPLKRVLKNYNKDAEM
jgi:hypothetical protein